MIRDSLGVPLEAEEYPHEPVKLDWLGRTIMSDGGEEYIDLEGDLILDDPDEIRAYVLQDAVIKDTYQLYEEMIKGG